MDASLSTFTTTSNISTADAFAAGGLAGFFATYSIVMIIVAVLTIIAQWRIFTKAGEAGWKCLIPIYNIVVLFKIAGISPWLVLGYLAAIIPVVGAFVAAGITIYALIKLSKAFGKSTGFTVGLILLNTIFILILGFGSSEYQLEKKA